MERIAGVGRPGTGRVAQVRPVGDATPVEPAPSRALVVLDGGRAAGDRPTASLRDGRTEAAFVTQLLVGANPSLQPSRLVRTRQAAAHYAEMARRLA